MKGLCGTEFGKEQPSAKADKQRRRGEVIHRRERQGVSSNNQLDQEGP